MDDKTKQYRNIQLDRIDMNPDFKSKLKIRGGEWGDGETNWLNITNEEFEQIKAILTGTAPLTLKDIQSRLESSDLISEHFGKELVANLNIRPKSNGRYNLAGGDKTEIGLARTVTRWFYQYFKNESK
jgi:hypothetical protein